MIRIQLLLTPINLKKATTGLQRSPFSFFPGRWPTFFRFFKISTAKGGEMNPGIFYLLAWPGA
jgi:hypothetical protein